MALDSTTAKGFYNKGVTEPDVAYITPKDAQDAIDKIYLDVNGAFTNLVADTAPANLGTTAVIGSSTQFALEDHVHPYTSIIATVNPANLAASAAQGSSNKLAREDHVHSNAGLAPTAHTHSVANITDIATTYAPLVSPGFSGAPTSSTAPAVGDNSTKIPNTSWATAALNLKADIAGPLFTGNARAVTVASTDNSISIATTAYVKSVIATYKMITAYTQTTTTSTFDTTKYLSVTLDGTVYKLALVV